MLKKLFTLSSIVLLVASCSNKLDVLAPYKESINVYGLLNENDSVNYIRIERVFLGEGNAYSMATTQDSVYFKPGEITAKLKCFNANGTQVLPSSSSASMEIVLQETNIPLSSGTFNTNQLIYKTNAKLFADGSYTYKLLVHNNKTGKDFSAQTKLIPGITLLSSTAILNNILSANNPHQSTPPAINICPSGGGTVKCVFDAPVNGMECGLVMRFFYTEYVGGSGTPKYIDIGLGNQYALSSSGGQELDFSFNGDSPLRSIATFIAPDASISYRTADSVSFTLSSAGYDLALYNQVNSSTSLSQNKPIYTNVNGGIGILSCRYQYNLPKRLSGYTLDRLDTSVITCHLLFLNQSHGHQGCH